MRRTGRALGWAGGAATSLAVALGLLVGLRSVVALDPPGLRGLLHVRLSPVDGLGMAWSARAMWPSALQDGAVQRLSYTVAALALAAALVALLNVVLLLAESGATRRREMAVRAAVGAPPGALTAVLLRDLRALLAVGTSVGLLAGMAGGALLRITWPGTTSSPGWGAALGTLVGCVGPAAGVAVLAYAHVGWWVGRHARLAPILLGGGRVSADRAEIFRRRALSALQMGMAGAVALGAVALALGMRRTESVAARAQDTVVVRVTLPNGLTGWDPVLGSLGGVEGLELAAVASEGAVLGLGVRDYATAQCGTCWRGGLPLPLWGAKADHHAVGPGFFEAAGLRVVAGRAFAPGDGPDAPRVAVVDETFAASSFQDGRPLGRRVRLGRDVDGWYEVVGVVEALPALGLGTDERPRETVWVSALQHAPRHGDVLLRGAPGAVAAAAALLREQGVSQGEPMSLAQAAREATAPLRWGAGLGLVLALLTSAFALGGVHATSLQVTRRRLQELATRRALGAPGARLFAHVLAGSAGTAAAGAALTLVFGSLAVALLRRVAAAVPSPGVGAYVAVVALLVAMALVASVRAGREALAVEPMQALE